MRVLHVLYLKRVKNTEKLSFQGAAASLPRGSHGPEFGLIHFRLHSL